MGVPNNLPPQLTSFIGRDREIADVTRLLAGARLLTLTGTGGCGKTRLSLQVAADLGDRFAQGAWFVPLAPLADPDLVVPTIAGVLGVQETGGRALLDSLTQHLRERQLLLVLDNFEQVLPAAAPVAALLAAAPGVRILVTSRAALRIYGEQEYPVPPLALPPKAGAPLAALAGSEAVRLFVARAAEVRPDFALTPENADTVAAICARLDGLPLAIELAAARSKILAPPALLARLAAATPAPALHLLTGGARDRPARQQTLRGAIAWSYDLLPPAEQALFRRLAVFVGGCTVAAAAAVGRDDEVVSRQSSVVSDESVGSRQYAVGSDDEEAGGGDPGAEATQSKIDEGGGGDPGAESTQSKIQNPKSKIDLLDGLSALIDWSLLVHEEGPEGELRCAMLETIREFGLEQLGATGEAAAVQRRHAAYFLALAQQGDRESRSPRQVAWLECLECEHDNLRAALGWALAHEEATTALALASALGWFWSLRGYWGEGRSWLARALQMTRTTAPRTHARAQALNWAGLLAYRQSDPAGARALLDESVAISRAMDDQEELAYALTLLGVMALYGGDPAGARALLDESVALFRAVGAAWGQALALRNLGEVAAATGDEATRRAVLTASVALFRQVGDGWGLALPLADLGAMARRQGDYAQASALFAESLALFRTLGDKQGMAWGLAQLAEVAGATGQPLRAAQLFGAAEALLDSIGARLDPVDRAEHAGHLAATRQTVPAAAWDAAWATGQALPLDAAIALGTAARGPAAPPRPPPPASAARGPAVDALTARELDVLCLLATGLTDAQIAGQLSLSPRTVQTHVRAIYSKLGITTRSAATRYAMEHRLA
ncbi:MAG TPA: LuxR C-terminal-related transcriptional regulator [Chloroflexia bacterium]|nr:LuxR C-terminal-related transcriptional regulator [Chloroflexia bacterium]